VYVIERLEDKVVAVTGGAKGIGKGCCLRFAAEGARVAVLDLAMQEAAEVAAECERLSGQPALALHCNVADPASVDVAVAAIMEAWGGLHILVASAGIYTGQPLTEVLLEDWQRTLDIDLTGVFLTNKAVAGILIQQCGGSIINISIDGGQDLVAGQRTVQRGQVGRDRADPQRRDGAGAVSRQRERGLPRQHHD
jgi:2-hydroxycyclohexanecarboxyl-CoA dehydrogenase